jgi:hypothetical protein
MNPPNQILFPSHFPHHRGPSSLSPSRQLHGPLLIQMLMHIERIPQQMRLMAPPLPQALKLCLVEVVQQDGPILRMRTLSDDDPGALARRQAPHVRKALLGDDDVEIVLGLVDVRAHGHDARDARGVCLGRPRRRRVHDAVFGRAEEVRRTAQPVQHPAAHDAGRVGVRVDVDFDRRVHADDAQPPDNFRRVRDLLRAEEKLGRVLVPFLVEAGEAVRGEAD